MEIKQDKQGMRYLKLFEGCFVHRINQWGWLLDWDKLNWFDMTFIEIRIEGDFVFDGLDFSIIILGLGFNLRYTSKEKREELEEELTNN